MTPLSFEKKNDSQERNFPLEENNFMSKTSENYKSFRGGGSSILDLDRSTDSSLDKIAEKLSSFPFLDNNGKSNVLFEKSSFSQIPFEIIKPTKFFHPSDLKKVITDVLQSK